MPIEFPIRVPKTRNRDARPFTFGMFSNSNTSGMGMNEVVIGTLIGANFNITTDQSITVLAGSWRITKIQVTNASVSMTTAAGGFYPSASKGGVPIVAASQVYSALTSSSVILNCTVAGANSVVTPIYLSLTTGQGAAATADVRVYGVKVG